jgi:signal transduction histidine kinase
MNRTDLFFSLDNPIIFSILACIAIGWLIYFFYVKVYSPLQSKHLLEKENLELKNSRLMAMFAEADPEPLFRFNSKGEIIFTNESGSVILDQVGITEPTVSGIFPILSDINYEKFIKDGDILLSTVMLDDNYYDVTVKGLPETGFGQIYCNDITARKNSEEALEKSTKRLRELSAYIQKVQEEEKKRISRELHDNFGQILTSIKMNVELLSGGNISGDVIPEIKKQLENARKEIRELSHNLRPRVLDDYGLQPALKMLCEDASKNTGIKGSFYSHNYSVRLSAEIESNIYRIVQEALNNIAKHSKASEFTVQLIQHADKLVISVADDGIGFSNGKKNDDSKSGMGMINIAERVFSMNGEFNMSSEPGDGTEIMIEIPLEG